MPKIIGAVIILFLATSAFCQKQVIGLRTGIGFTNVKNELFEDIDMRVGLVAGVMYDYLLTDNLSVGGEITFIQRGFQDDFYIRSDQNEPIETKTSKFSYNYISIPLKITYSGSAKFYLYASGGLLPAFVINASHDIPSVPGYVGGKINVTSRVTKLDLAGMAETGAGYKISERYRLFVSLSVHVSLTKFTNDNYFTGADARHYGYALSTGIKYALSGK